MDFSEYQRLANQTDQQPETDKPSADSRAILVPLLGLASETGELLGEHKKWIRDGDSYRLFPERVKEELGDILWYLANVATKHGLDLGDVAEYNLNKIDRRWGAATTQPDNAHPLTAVFLNRSAFRGVWRYRSGPANLAGL